MAYRTVRVFAAGFALCLMSGAASADMVVVHVTGPGLKAGQVIPTGSSVTLPAASKAVLLTRDGRTVSLAGPFSGPVSEPAASGSDDKSVTALSRLLTASAADSSALGVTRAADFTSPYAISVKGGAHCQVPGEKPRFQREIGSPEEHLTVSAASGSPSQSLTWAEDEGELDWPASIPFEAGAYTLRLDTQPKPGELTVQLMPAGVKGPAAQAVWMADHGCSAQAIRLLTSLR